MIDYSLHFYITLQSQVSCECRRPGVRYLFEQLHVKLPASSSWKRKINPEDSVTSLICITVVSRHSKKILLKIKIKICATSDPTVLVCSSFASHCVICAALVPLPHTKQTMRCNKAVNYWWQSLARTNTHPCTFLYSHQEIKRKLDTRPTLSYHSFKMGAKDLWMSNTATSRMAGQQKALWSLGLTRTWQAVLLSYVLSQTKNHSVPLNSLHHWENIDVQMGWVWILPPDKNIYIGQFSKTNSKLKYLVKVWKSFELNANVRVLKFLQWQC